MTPGSGHRIRCERFTILPAALALAGALFEPSAHEVGGGGARAEGVCIFDCSVRSPLLAYSRRRLLGDHWASARFRPSASFLLLLQQCVHSQVHLPRRIGREAILVEAGAGEAVRKGDRAQVTHLLGAADEERLHRTAPRLCDFPEGDLEDATPRLREGREVRVAEVAVAVPQVDGHDGEEEGERRPRGGGQTVRLEHQLDREAEGG
eukprot:CAMPEP_0182808868 /NCGR_PEP_ID=MMETSP0006_2-20121128/6878_1 /TAXON_ID=97485 /ORGANISM="Prymnesium parvum, Strain Texoma1" /LENGTH=206 /DNA_ID=CAMNT_0024934611 /DNA_START=413 /DNA_END=1031 /DNA_ORIENTATION=-